MKITDNVRIVPGVAANVYVLIDGRELTLIDAGLPFQKGRILQYVRDMRRSPQDIVRILLTHADWDHVGSLPALHKTTGARTFASRIEADALAAGRSSRPTRVAPRTPLHRRLMRIFSARRPFRVNQIVSPGEVLPVLGGLHVIDTAGHCPGHISFFLPSEGILFCGDSMVTDEAGIHGSRPVFTWDAALAESAVRTQAGLGARILCSGHGPVVFDAAGRFPV